MKQEEKSGVTTLVSAISCVVALKPLIVGNKCFCCEYKELTALFFYYTHGREQDEVDACAPSLS